MARLNLLLLLAVLASALYLVRTQYESRRLYVELEKATAEARKIEMDNERLQVEKRAQATPLKVEKLAKEQLQMRTTSPAITQYVRPDGSVIPAVAPVAPAMPATTGAKPAGTPPTCAVPSALNVILALAGIWKAPQTPVAVPQPTSSRPSRIERGSSLRSFQPNFSAPSR